MDDAAKRLAAAVLEQALKDYNGNHRRNAEDAERWIEKKGQDTFEFYWCLEHSEVNPNLVRRYLKECDGKKEN